MLAGYVDPGSLLFTREHLEQISEVVRTKAEALTTLDAQCTDAAPALLMVSTHRAMVTMAKCTESRANMMVCRAATGWIRGGTCTR